jgi:hypothetical protein
MKAVLITVLITLLILAVVYLLIGIFFTLRYSGADGPRLTFTNIVKWPLVFLN